MAKVTGKRKKAKGKTASSSSTTKAGNGAVGVLEAGGRAPAVQDGRGRDGRWTPGMSGNPRGCPNRGALVNNWADQMAEWPRHRIHAAAYAGQQLPWTQVMAARHLLRGGAIGYAKSGRPHAIEDFRELLDRSLGKPAQAIEIHQTHTVHRVETWEAFGGILETNMTLCQRVHELTGEILARRRLEAGTGVGGTQVVSVAGAGQPDVASDSR